MSNKNRKYEFKKLSSLSYVLRASHSYKTAKINCFVLNNLCKQIKWTVSLKCKDVLTCPYMLCCKSRPIDARPIGRLWQWHVRANVNSSLHVNDTVHLNCLHKLFSTKQLIFAVLQL